MSSYVLQIRYVSGHDERRLFSMPVVKIGRAVGDICLYDREASTRHAKLLFDGEALFYFDLGSTHGSFDQNDHRIVTPRKLREGDVVRIGECEIGIEQINRINRIESETLVPVDNFSDEIDILLESLVFCDIDLREGSYSGAWAPLKVKTTTTYQSQSITSDANEECCSKSVGKQSNPALRFLFPTSGTWLERISAEVEDTWKLLMHHRMQVFCTWPLLLIAAAFLRVLTGWIPILGTFVNILSAFVLIGIGPFAILALGYVLLYARIGQPIRAMQAWELALRQSVAVWATIVVALLVSCIASLFFLIPGIMVGVFILPVLLLEDSHYLTVSRRSVKLFQQSPRQILGVVLVGVGLPVVATLSLLFMFTETLGTMNNYAISTIREFAISMISGGAFAFWVAWSCSSYMRLRMKLDGEPAILIVQEQMRRMISSDMDESRRSNRSLAQVRTGIQIAPG